RSQDGRAESAPHDRGCLPVGVPAGGPEYGADGEDQADDGDEGGLYQPGDPPPGGPWGEAECGDEPGVHVGGGPGREHRDEDEADAEVPPAHGGNSEVAEKGGGGGGGAGVGDVADAAVVVVAG